MISIRKIFEMYGVNSEGIKLVRHTNKEITILETFENNLERFEAYQSFQPSNKYGNATRIAVFSSYHKTTALFLGLWDITGFTENSNLPKNSIDVLEKHKLPQNWINELGRYMLKMNPLLQDLSRRLVIEWGAGTLAWIQSGDKEVLEIKGRNSIGEFHSFQAIHLSHNELCKMVDSPDSNHTWVKALSSVNGVYLIKDQQSGLLYVGSAYGENGIYSRWSEYARTGHGGNQKLIGLNPKYFSYSILEVMPSTSTADDAIHCENGWKNKLGTREHGLNEN